MFLSVQFKFVRQKEDILRSSKTKMHMVRNTDFFSVSILVFQIYISRRQKFNFDPVFSDKVDLKVQTLKIYFEEF